MEKLSFEILLGAHPEIVWKVLWGNSTYPAWTAAFSEGSHAITDWKKGSKVLFLNGKNRGMVSIITENIPNQLMSFQHLGEVKNGIESLYAKSEYPGFTESYTLQLTNDKTSLTINMQVPPGLGEYLHRKWPKALTALKNLVE